MIYYEKHRADPPGGIYHQWNNDIDFSPHLHDSFELICVHKGKLNVVIDNIPATVCEGQAVLIFPNQIHATQPSYGTQTYLCIFQNSLVGEFYRLVENTMVECPVFNINDCHFTEKLTDPNNSRYQLKALLYEVIHQFDVNCGEYQPRTVKSTNIIGEALVYIATNYKETINMQTIATTLGYDYHYLSNVFQKNLHTTFRAILNEYRISQAKRLLISANSTISGIAYDCGYESIVSFNRNFKKLVGITPCEFREKHHKRTLTSTQGDGSVSHPNPKSR